MLDPIEHDLRHGALPGVGFAARFVIDRHRQALERASAVERASRSDQRLRGGSDRTGQGRRGLRICVGVRQQRRVAPVVDQRGVGFFDHVVEGRAGEAFAGRFERHRFRHGPGFVVRCAERPVRWCRHGRNCHGRCQRQRAATAACVAGARGHGLRTPATAHPRGKVARAVVGQGRRGSHRDPLCGRAQRVMRRVRDCSGGIGRVSARDSCRTKVNGQCARLR